VTRVTGLNDRPGRRGANPGKRPAPRSAWTSAPATRCGLACTYELFVWRAAGRGDANGWTHPTDRVVRIADGLEGAQAVRTLIHELAHVVLHTETSSPSSSGPVHCRGVREVEAESVAFLVCTSRGMAADGDTFPYVAGWAEEIPGDNADSPRHRNPRPGRRAPHPATHRTGDRAADRRTPTHRPSRPRPARYDCPAPASRDDARSRGRPCGTATTTTPLHSTTGTRGPDPPARHRAALPHHSEGGIMGTGVPQRTRPRAGVVSTVGRRLRPTELARTRRSPEPIRDLGRHAPRNWTRRACPQRQAR
jgi:hypothetical protein